ncbi:MAG: RNA-binding protein [Bacteroidaceae bacterium]|nr:RNA-binding protein [Bacteroidaceae bacterium]
MELYIKDRIYIPQLLPQQTKSFMDFNVKREILKKVTLTEKDKETYSIEEDVENRKITWNAEKDQQEPLVVEFTNEEVTMLKRSCEQLAETAYPDDFWLTVEKIYNAANGN